MVRELFHPWLDSKWTILLNRKCLKLGNLRIELANVYAILFELMRKRYVLERHQFLRVIPACKFAYIIQRHDKCLPCLKYTPTVDRLSKLFLSKANFRTRKAWIFFFSPSPHRMPFPRRLEIRETFDKWRISNHDRIRDFSLSLYFYSRHEKILVSLIMLRV